ncbi:protein of unknown function DUF402 [Ferroglobus placidus DSM 10642]|uniref:Probable ribonuclease FAU-1 n=1 Tax=Ferroglobus placidus (strain DSM 10642 / AEDII12DO) TaxID=589924 RepID=D3S2N9_FERPA|nr:DUF402 domain-containing protein [Ferroglobus placidus]ADC64569.1 protein of unknown function DUF402 [Ferroglobus placidus DSM 10642]
MRVRVRGIYSTAITKILLEEGLEVSHSSKKIRERFNLPENREPPTVTVKDTEQKHGVVIVGEYEHGKKVHEVLKKRVERAFSWTSKLPLHAIIKGKVVKAEKGKSVVDLGEYKGILDEEVKEGSEILVDVSRPFLPHEDYAKLSTNYTIYGKFVALIKGAGKKVIFSKHIANRSLKSDLLRLSALADVRDWSVKWRSSAAIGEFSEMIKDLKETYEKAEEIVEKGEEAEVGEIVYEGEFFSILCFGREAKKRLDDTRASVLPTIEGHHSLKSMNESEVVDLAEHILSHGIGDRERISKAVESYVASLMREQSLVSIEHVSLLSGEVKRLTPGKVVEANEDSFRMRRVFRSRGIYDGLNVEKNPGDYDLMEFSTKLPLVLHKYFGREGEFKGVYVNLNTPPEISRNAIRYVDVEIDVVATNEKVEVIDRESLERCCELGIISEDMKASYVSIAESLKDFLINFENLAEITIEDMKKVVKAQG